MKLNDIGPKATHTKINQICESRFGFQIDFRNLSMGKAKQLTRAINETLSKVRRSSSIHSSEQNPKYMELITVREGLAQWMRTQTTLTESEMGQAEAILAAKDMVDSVQDMIEKVGKLQHEQLPALIDTIRDQIGSAQADQYKQTVGQTLEGLVGQLSQAREQLDQGARGLTGEAAPTDMALGGDMGADMGADMGGDAGSIDDLGAEDMGDEFGATDAAAGGASAAGRDRR
jgi:chromosome condensin MukBEF ATPase and DNA-binding subunit MukB